MGDRNSCSEQYCQPAQKLCMQVGLLLVPVLHQMRIYDSIGMAGMPVDCSCFVECADVVSALKHMQGVLDRCILVVSVAIQQLLVRRPCMLWCSAVMPHDWCTSFVCVQQSGRLLLTVLQGNVDVSLYVTSTALCCISIEQLCPYDRQAACDWLTTGQCQTRCCAPDVQATCDLQPLHTGLAHHPLF